LYGLFHFSSWHRPILFDRILDAYNALEPHICEEIMTLHHKKHHQTYVNGLNAAEQSYAQASPKARIALQSAIKFNGGGKLYLEPSITRAYVFVV
jgi:superoxide dismutase